MHTSLNGISEFNKLLFVGLGKRVKGKGRKGIALQLSSQLAPLTTVTLLSLLAPLVLTNTSWAQNSPAPVLTPPPLPSLPLQNVPPLLLPPRPQDNRTSQGQVAHQTEELSVEQILKRSEREVEGGRLWEQGLRQLTDNQFQEALHSCEAALAIYQEVHSYSEPYALICLGRIHTALAQFQQAVTFYQQALSVLQGLDSSSDRQAEAQVLKGLGRAYHALGQYQQAIEAYQTALPIYQDMSGIEELSGGAALRLFSKTDQEEVINTFRNRQRAGEADTLSELGNAYLTLGQYQRAIELFQQALSIYQQLGIREEELKTLAKVGSTYSVIGQLQEGFRFYQQAIKVSDKIDDQKLRADLLMFLSFYFIVIAFEDYEQSINAYQEALAIYQKLGLKGEEAGSFAILGMTYTVHKQYQLAIPFYRQGLAIAQEINAPQLEAWILQSMGSALLNDGRPTEAEPLLFKAIKIFESLRIELKQDTDKISFFDTQIDPYISLQKALVAQNKTASALEIAERGRARILVELLATRLPDFQIAEIATTAPDLRAIQRIAQQQNATLVQYSVINTMVGSSALYIWVIQPTGEIHFQAIDLSTLDRPLSDLVITSREAIGVRNRSELATIVPELKPEAQQRQQAQQRQKLQQLHQLLIEPIAQYLPTNPDERVIFIPQGELFLVPFPALVDAQGKYLIEKHTILTAPSIQVLDLTRQQRQLVGQNRHSPIQGDNVLVVGNPIMPRVWNPAKGIEEQLSSLPGAEEEAVTIAKVFATKPLLWEQASESTVVQRMPQARIIHLSTHGLLEYGSPQDSGVRDFPGAIALSPSAKDDGLLTSAEILKMKLKAELVVLSACDTGRGRITGDGVIGLSRSLITAGVPSVIVSLWSVPDAPTAELMSEFYRQWQQNPDKAKALRQAMLITMQNHPNPRDWAAFTLIGESE